jgi:hypothetical protein
MFVPGWIYGFINSQVEILEFLVGSIDIQM